MLQVVRSELADVSSGVAASVAPAVQQAVQATLPKVCAASAPAAAVPPPAAACAASGHYVSHLTGAMVSGV